MSKRGEPLPINQALNRPRAKLGLDLTAWMAIVFVCVTVFLVGFRLLAMVAFAVTPTHREGKAEEDNGHGLFTGLLLEGLNGSAADVLGNVTPASLYSLVDQTLGPWEQRPLYKANVQSFVTLRQVTPKVPREILRKLPAYFPNPTTVFALDPSYEPDRENVPESVKNQPVPLIGIYCNSDRKPAYLPRELSGVRVLNWTWTNLGNFMDRL